MLVRPMYAATLSTEHYLTISDSCQERACIGPMTQKLTLQLSEHMLEVKLIFVCLYVCMCLPLHRLYTYSIWLVLMLIQTSDSRI
jgi:hypothetical protein